LIDRVFFTRWDNPPTKAEVAEVDQRLAEASQQVKQPIIWVACVAAKAKLADAEERKNLNDMMNVVRKFAEKAYLMYEGPELQVNLQRVIISGVMIFTRAYADFQVLAKNGDEVAKDLTKLLNRDMSSVVNQAKQAGLIV
jgi:hypothetical protein